MYDCRSNWTLKWCSFEKKITSTFPKMANLVTKIRYNLLLIQNNLNRVFEQSKFSVQRQLPEYFLSFFILSFFCVWNRLQLDSGKFYQKITLVLFDFKFNLKSKNDFWILFLGNFPQKIQFKKNQTITYNFSKNLSNFCGFFS